MGEICCRGGGCPGVDLASKFLSPDEVLRQKYAGNFYKNHGTLARVVFIPLGLISGLVKGVLFPLIIAVNTVVLTLIAIVKVVKGKGGDTPYWQAAALSFVGMTACVAFLVISAYYLPISAASGIYLTGVAVSIAVHVYRACKDPVVEGGEYGGGADFNDLESVASSSQPGGTPYTPFTA